MVLFIFSGRLQTKANSFRVTTPNLGPFLWKTDWVRTVCRFHRFFFLVLAHYSFSALLLYSILHGCIHQSDIQAIVSGEDKFNAKLKGNFSVGSLRNLWQYCAGSLFVLRINQFTYVGRGGGQPPFVRESKRKPPILRVKHNPEMGLLLETSRKETAQSVAVQVTLWWFR